MQTFIVGSVSDRHAWQSLIKENKVSLCDIVELRLDTLPKDLNFNSLLSHNYQGKPIIVTLRHSSEGGSFNGTESDRLSAFKHLLPIFEYVDVEINFLSNEIIDFLHTNNKKVIASYHNFSNTPSQEALQELKAYALGMGADIVKFATTMTSETDLETGRSLLCTGENVAVMGMGELSLKSRLEYAHNDPPSIFTYGVYRCGQTRIKGLITDYTLKKQI